MKEAPKCDVSEYRSFKEVSLGGAPNHRSDHHRSRKKKKEDKIDLY